MKKEIDPVRLEELAASGAKNSAICTTLGIHEVTFYTKLKKDRELKAAYERGRARAKEAKGPVKAGTSKSSAIEIEPQDQDVLDAVEAAGKHGATMASIKRVDTVKGMEESEIDASLRKLAALGRIHVLPEGVNQTETFYLGKGQDADRALRGATTMATKKSAGKKGPASKKRGGAPKRAAKRSGKRRASQNNLSEGEKVEVVGRAADPADSNGSPSHAIGAAYVELTYIRQWGKPSPMCDEVIGMLASFRPQAETQSPRG
jgi:hypothetical protein